MTKQSEESEEIGGQPVMTYESCGVNYGAMDPFKILAQQAGLTTSLNALRFGYREVDGIRGESCYLMHAPWGGYLAHVEEGLGTKNLVADAASELGLGEGAEFFWSAIGQDTVAMIVNDMATVGAQPLSVAMHFAVGDSAIFDNRLLIHGLIHGWARACDMARCVWGGGETPTLKGIITPGTAVLAGSAVGYIMPGRSPIKGIPHDGDAIILINSNGVHANGLTACRKIADKLPDGYRTRLPDGTTFGEALLRPTHIYVPAVQDCLSCGVDIHCAINITGHGWRKLMRAATPMSYVIDRLPEQQPIFDFIQEHGPMDDYEAYGNFNMGAGFALIVPRDEVQTIVGVFEEGEYGYDFVVAGHVEASDRRQVVIKPKNLVFEDSTLTLR